MRPRRSLESHMTAIDDLDLAELASYHREDTEYESTHQHHLLCIDCMWRPNTSVVFGSLLTVLITAVTLSAQYVDLDGNNDFQRSQNSESNPLSLCQVQSASDKIDCGFPGITADECLRRGCCWHDAVPEVWCYHGLSIFANHVPKGKPALLQLSFLETTPYSWVEYSEYIFWSRILTVPATEAMFSLHALELRKKKSATGREPVLKASVDGEDCYEMHNVSEILVHIEKGASIKYSCSLGTVPEDDALMSDRVVTFQLLELSDVQSATAMIPSVPLEEIDLVAKWTKVGSSYLRRKWNPRTPEQRLSSKTRCHQGDKTASYCQYDNSLCFEVGPRRVGTTIPYGASNKTNQDGTIVRSGYPTLFIEDAHEWLKSRGQKISHASLLHRVPGVPIGPIPYLSGFADVRLVMPTTRTHHPNTVALPGETVLIGKGYGCLNLFHFLSETIGPLWSSQLAVERERWGWGPVLPRHLFPLDRCSVFDNIIYLQESILYDDGTHPLDSSASCRWGRELLKLIIGFDPVRSVTTSTSAGAPTGGGGGGDDRCPDNKFIMGHELKEGTLYCPERATIHAFSGGHYLSGNGPADGTDIFDSSLDVAAFRDRLHTMLPHVRCLRRQTINVDYPHRKVALVVVRKIRRIANLEDLRALLDRRLAANGWDVQYVDTGSLPFEKQVEAFACAKLIIAVHGAGLANMVFAPKGSVLLYIEVPMVSSIHHFDTAMVQLGVTMIKYLSKADENIDWGKDDFNIDIDEFGSFLFAAEHMATSPAKLDRSEREKQQRTGRPRSLNFLTDEKFEWLVQHDAVSV